MCWRHETRCYRRLCCCYGHQEDSAGGCCSCVVWWEFYFHPEMWHKMQSNYAAFTTAVQITYHIAVFYITENMANVGLGYPLLSSNLHIHKTIKSFTLKPQLHVLSMSLFLWTAPWNFYFQVMCEQHHKSALNPFLNGIKTVMRIVRVTVTFSVMQRIDYHRWKPWEHVSLVTTGTIPHLGASFTHVL